MRTSRASISVWDGEKLQEGPGSVTRLYASAPGWRITIRPARLVMDDMLARENTESETSCQVSSEELLHLLDETDRIRRLADVPLGLGALDQRLQVLKIGRAHV